MKSLNRTLSLVLVLAMCLGLMGIASAATFTDAAKIQYTEAVSVMTGIGAINGYTDGTFAPTATITREEAAKMITFAILGPTVAAKLSVGATGFSDVVATRWSAPYIAYCVSKGIINGMGDGTFAPTANVTGYQLAKMMLCAAGYGAKGEYTGASWELNVAVDANKYKVFSGAKAANYSAAATREEAALYVFNALTKTTMTVYNKLFDTYTAQTPTTSSIADVDGNTFTQLCELVYGSLKTASVGTVDGIAAYRWTLNGLPISGVVGNATVLKTSSNGTPISVLTNTAKSAFVGYYPNTDVAGTTVVLKTYLNGDAVDTTATLGTISSSVEAASAKNGAIVKFIDEGVDGKYDTISVTVDTLSKITAAPVTTTSGTVTTVTVGGILGLANVNVTKVVGYEGLAKDDYVMWHKDTNGNYFIDGKCTSVTGTLQALNTSAGTLTVDGKTYEVSGITGADTISAIQTAALGKASTTFLIDNGGFVCKAVPATAAVTLSNTLFVVSAQPVGYAAQAYVVLPDGTAAVVTPAKLGTTAISAANVSSITANTFYTYVKNDNGTYNLTAIANTQAAVAANDAAGANNTAALTDPNATISTSNGTDTFYKITKASANFLTAYASAAGTSGNKWAGTAANVLATSATAFTYRNETTMAYSTATGIIAAASYTAVADDSTIAYLCDANGYAIWVVAFGGATDTTTTAADYVFPVLPGTLIYNAAGNYYTFSAVVNGEIKTIDAANAEDTTSDANLSIGVLTSVASYTSGKVATTDDTVTMIQTLANNTGLDDFVFNGSTVAYKDNSVVKGSFIVTDATKYFIYDTTKTVPTITAATADDVNALSGGTYAIQAIQTSLTDTRIAQLFVTVSANADLTAALTAKAGTTAAINGTVAGTAPNKTVAVASATADTAYTLKLTADPNATITYSTVSGGAGAYVASTGTETVTTAAGASATTVVYFKVTNGTPASTYTYTVTITNAA